MHYYIVVVAVWRWWVTTDALTVLRLDHSPIVTSRPLDQESLRVVVVVLCCFGVVVVGVMRLAVGYCMGTVALAVCLPWCSSAMFAG